MYYSIISILALIILVILNHETLFKKNLNKNRPLQKSYRLFLFSIIAYYITDILWGIFDHFHLSVASFIDTELYFVAMAIGILFWTRYVVAYLRERNIYGAILHYAGIGFFAGVTVMVIINIFAPVMFRIDEEGNYITTAGRYIILITQIILLLLTSVYATIITVKTIGSIKQRHMAIAFFGIIMLVFIFIQLFKPDLPLYAMGYLTGSCLLHSFVIGGEKASYRKELEAALKREDKQLKELQTAWDAAYTDAMTGAKSKLAFLEESDRLDKEIADGTIQKMAIALFDVNGLKIINDTMGHDTGDEYIKKAFVIICKHFNKSPVFRTGGDEFVAVLEGDDYCDRQDLINSFNEEVEMNKTRGEVVISLGVADYRQGVDHSCKKIFDRADALMYRRKEELKREE
ncbi:MAG: GGDEF domain-containing protein [Clostridia bacterium]|nr:GGDEF domain-containing protein [Clostridia bacterium]